VRTLKQDQGGSLFLCRFLTLPFFGHEFDLFSSFRRFCGESRRIQWQIERGRKNFGKLKTEAEIIVHF
jgi:hypothetical protein